ncbi:sensor histidine kinase [Bartonella sp. DGB1]|uniref:sensor histidine kinase n=1 Tax=Bartonella sp. DGB1 TaxID=3239807 RepID=UPI003524384D
MYSLDFTIDKKIKAIRKGGITLISSIICLMIGIYYYLIIPETLDVFLIRVVFIFLLFSLLFSYFTVIGLYNSIKKMHNYQNLCFLESKILEKKRTEFLEVEKKQVELKIITVEEEKQRAESLLQDTSHRVGNALANVSALLTLQIKNNVNEEVKNALMSARDRIQTISIAHRRLRLAETYDKAPVYDILCSVVKDAYKTLPDFIAKRITLQFDIQPLELPGKDVTTIAIILGELVTNSFKHAFPPPTCGYVRVIFGYQQGKLQLIVEDNGKGRGEMMNSKNKDGLGKMIIEPLCLQLGDPVNFSNLQSHEPYGTRVCVSLSKIAAKNTLASNMCL